ncbi:hypothetical protein RTP6_7698 [Batrachochytrium dendrobatidis]
MNNKARFRKKQTKCGGKGVGKALCSITRQSNRIAKYCFPTLAKNEYKSRNDYYKECMKLYKTTQRGRQVTQQILTLLVQCHIYCAGLCCIEL